MAYSLTYEQLRKDLDEAFILAAKGKSGKQYVRDFAANLEKNLDQLCLELWTRTYRPLPSDCFATDEREVYAARFRDRIVHHLYFNYTHRLFERTFIADSYSCIKGRGIHYGINRIRQHIQQESRNYTRRCYALYLDIKGYFMHINREKLCKAVKSSLDTMRYHRIKKHSPLTWDDILDFEFIYYLTEIFTLLDPLANCIIKGSLRQLQAIPKRKRLRFSSKGSGVPIGNLTSQLFSNIFLNLLDQFIKRCLRVRYYGRYVDDARLISCSIRFLKACLVLIDAFICSLGLELQHSKTRIVDIYKGVSFCGAFLMPFRDYISTAALKRIKSKIHALRSDFNSGRCALAHYISSLQSFTGTLSHFRTYNISKHIMPYILG